MKSLSKYPVLFPAAFIAQQFIQFRFSDSWRSKSCILMSSKTNKPFLITNRIFNLRESPFFFSTIQFFRSVTFLFSFSFHHENYHHSLHNHIFIVFPSRPPPLPHYYCFPTTTTFLLFSLPHLPISIVFPTPPLPQPHFQCTV